MIERTLTIIKPDSVRNHNVGNIVARLEQEEFRIVAGRMLRLTESQARAFYAVHAERPVRCHVVGEETLEFGDLATEHELGAREDAEHGFIDF